MTAHADDNASAGALGILGGTFDPIHAGHLALAQEAMLELDLEEVLFVPNADPPHKQDQVVTPARHREAMVALAIEHEPAFVLSRIELERPGPSYAVETVKELAARCRAEGRPEPWFILSAEVLDELHTWRDPLGILDSCRIAVGPRPGSESLDRDWVSEHYPGHEDRFTFLPGPELDIASTGIREQVADGGSVADLVPPAVADYIHAQGLYGAEAATDSEGSEPAADRQEEDAIVDQEQQPLAESPQGGAPDGMNVGGATEADPVPDVEVEATDEARPGLPTRRGPAASASRPRLTILPGEVDETALGLAHRIVELASEKKASDVVLLDVRGQTTMTDYFVICSGASDRQLAAISAGIIEGVKEGGDAPVSREGDAASHWLLIDFGGVIVHVMSAPEREYYQLEKLWSDAALLLRIL